MGRREDWLKQTEHLYRAKPASTKPIPNYAMVRSHESGWNLDWEMRPVELISTQDDEGSLRYTEVKELDPIHIRRDAEAQYTQYVEYGKRR